MAINTKLYNNKIKQNLWANKTFNIFYYNFTTNEKRFRGLIDLTDKPSWNKKDRVSYTEAELVRIKNKKKDDIIDDRITLNNFMDKHLRYHPETNWKKNKKNFYDYNIRKTSLGKMMMKNIKALHVQEAMKRLEDRGLKQRTVGRLLEIARILFKEAVDNRIVDYNPMVLVKWKKPITKKIVTNATEELKKIHIAIENEFFRNPFQKAFFAFAMQGRRRTEIMTLRWEDVDFNNNVYILRKTKNNEEQKIFLPENIKELLLQFKNDSQEWVFTSRYTGSHITSIQHNINLLKERLDNKEFCLHYLRNVIVSAMAERGLESMYLSGALGHNDPNTIKKYLTMNYLKSSEMASNVISDIVGK